MPATVTELFADRIQTIESNGKYKSMELFYLVKGAAVGDVNGDLYQRCFLSG